MILLKTSIAEQCFVCGWLPHTRTKNVNHIERKLQIYLNKLHKWTTENGLKFPHQKTKWVHFCNQQKLHHDPVFKLDNTEIPVVDQYKYLGVIFDHKLSFIRWCPRGVMVKAMDCRIVVREFVLQSRNYVHFRTNTLGKGMKPLILLAMG